MTKQRFAIGSEMDLMSGAEWAGGVEKIISALVSLRQPPEVMDFDATVNVDTGGNLNLLIPGTVYQVPAGAMVSMHRISIYNSTYTPAAPLTSGWIAVVTDGPQNPPDAFFPGGGNSPPTWTLPAVASWGERQGPRLHETQRVVLTGASLPAGLVLSVRIQVVFQNKPHVMRLNLAGRTRG